MIKKQANLYSLSTCPMCKMVKKRIKDLNISCEIIDVDLLDSGEQWLTVKELKKYNPDVTYPTMVVHEVLKDFSEDKMKEVFGIK